MEKWMQEWIDKKDQQSKTYVRLFSQLKKQETEQIIQKTNAIHEQVFQEIDCLACANCCKSANIVFTIDDCQRINAFLNTDIAQQISFLEMPTGEFILQQQPCPFLNQDNRCTIYKVRPKSCHDFPHFREQSPSTYRQLHETNSLRCPATFHILQRLAKITDAFV